ncbi:TIGR02444 family protein [Fodinicurvata halophila]|uniref:TIGR02444 family protein n=1 Tax=Fodinicurvata halophila TaxID=1419723 RepID=A0ABV8URJ8_9PROT
MTDAENDRGQAMTFWDFSLLFYGRQGVADACLELQDRHGLDVNLVLFCFWAATCGKALGEEEFARLSQASRDWQAQVVQPLREVRRWMKRPDLLEREDCVRLRESIKRQELEAERLQQTFLAEALPMEVTPASEEEKTACAVTSLNCLLSRHALPTLGNKERSLERLLQEFKAFLQS